MKRTPCKDCPDKGCGSYHDKCSEYLEWAKTLKEASHSIPATRGTKPHMERSKTFRRSKNNIVLQDHRK
jgi:hypothetical protein